MTALLVDTNSYTALQKGNAEIERLFSSAEKLYFPFIVVGELLAGFRLGSREAVNREKLFALLDTPDVEILYPDLETMEDYASIFTALRKKGKPVPTNDIWIAACGSRHGLPICTFDKHFREIEGINIIVPEASA